MKQTRIAAAVALAMTLAANISANAAEITVISSNALKSVMEQLAPDFEKATEHKLVMVWGAAVPLQAQIEKGAAFDLAILPTAAIDDLARQGKLVGATRTALASSGAGVAVRKGAPKPDISTVEAFKAALLNAKSVAYVEQGGTVQPRDRFAGGGLKSTERRYGSLKAIDPATGEIKANTKFPYQPYSGVLATAGNIVFTGHLDGTFAAYDAKTLAELWSHNVGAGINAPPITYSINGKQYVAVLVGARERPNVVRESPELKNVATTHMLFVFGL